MDENKIFDKLEKLEYIAVRQEVNLAKLTVSVEEHVKRSNMLEDEQKKQREELEPLKKHVAMTNGALKLIGLFGIIASIVLAVVETITFILAHLH